MFKEWRDVVGFEGYYSVSNFGAVRRDAPASGAQPGRIKSTYLDRAGYPCVLLNAGGKKRTVAVHRLVGEAFLGATTSDIVDHIDRDRANCRLSNLRLCDAKGNSRNRNPKSGKRFLGVHKARSGNWIATARMGGASVHGGTFKCEEAAAAAYNVIATSLFGDNASLNLGVGPLPASEIDRLRDAASRVRCALAGEG